MTTHTVTTTTAPASEAGALAGFALECTCGARWTTSLATIAANESADHVDESAPMTCADCGAPAHYDDDVEDYRHDDPATPQWFLIRGDA